jgi:hypothetical protein
MLPEKRITQLFKIRFEKIQKKLKQKRIQRN